MPDVLLASGCSYTDPYFKSLDTSLPEEANGGWPMWPELLGKDLGLKVINSAESGLDNLSMHNRIVRDILNYGSDVKLVCILWSGFDRFRFMNFKTIGLMNQLRMIQYPHHANRKFSDIFSLTGLNDWLNNLVSHEHFPTKRVIINSFIDSFTYMNSIAEICELKGIPYVFYQGVQPFNCNAYPFSENDVFGESLKDVLKSPMYSHTEKRKNNIIGWPLVTRCFDNEPARKNNDCLAVSNFDYHPNSEGQRLISEIFMKKYQELVK